MALREATNVFEMTSAFPRHETYALSDQIRRSSRAVSALVAEAWARRRYPKAFVNILNQAQAEAMETQAWLDHAVTCRYLDKAAYERSDAAWQRIGGKLQRMIERAGSFASSATSSRSA